MNGIIYSKKRLNNKRRRKHMLAKMTEKDLEDGKKINELFLNLSEEGQIMVIAYMSALQDKEVADSTKRAG